MNKRITINYFGHERFRYLKYFLNEIVKIKDPIKKILNINLIFTDQLNEGPSEAIDFLEKNNISSKYFITAKDDHRNYLNKIQIALENSHEYSVKYDEDIFLNSSSWEFFLENSNVLENENNLFLAPIVTNGIPTADIFIEQFFDENSKKEIHNLLLKTPFSTIWGVNYSILNQHTIEAKEWIANNFYNGVKNINHPYKGIHPVRLSKDAQLYIINYILNNFDRFINQKEYSISESNRPYYCNNILMIKTSIWRNIMSNPSLFVDPYDEVPINLYRQINNLKMLFINNCFAVHPAYNVISTKDFSYEEISDLFFNHSYFKNQ